MSILRFCFGFVVYCGQPQSSIMTSLGRLLRQKNVSIRGETPSRIGGRSPRSVTMLQRYSKNSPYPYTQNYYLYYI